MAEIVREAVRAYIAPPRHAGPPGAGAFASGHADTAERVDDVLAATGFGDSSAAVSPVQSRTGRRRSTTRARTPARRR